MKIRRSLGLVVEGNSTSSAILRLPYIAEELGPIKSGALRVARRVCNFLCAGYAVQSYEDLAAARIVLIRVPDTAVSRIVHELCASALALEDMTFALCDTYLEAAELNLLRQRGATVVSVLQVHSFRQSWFVLEGQLAGVRQLRKFIEHNDGRVFELRSGSKPLFSAAQLLSTVLPLELFSTAQKALRSAGISGNRLHDLLEEFSFEMFRVFMNGGRVSHRSLQAKLLGEKDYHEYLRDLRSRYPQIALALEQYFHLAMVHTNATET